MTRPALWRPTPTECRQIRAFACRAAGVASVTLRPQRRISTSRPSDPTLNLALITHALDATDYADGMDLYDEAPWGAFVSGVPLSDDGRSAVEIAVYSRGHGSELKAHVTVAYAHGQIMTFGAS